MAKLPTVPQADIEEALTKVNKQSLAVGENMFQQLKINTGLLQVISESIIQSIELEEMRDRLAKQREGLLIEALRETKRAADEPSEGKSSGKKFKIKDLLGFDPKGLEWALIGGALMAAAIALKENFEELTIAIQGFVAFKLGTKAMDLLKGVGRTILKPFEMIVDGARGLARSFKQSKLATRFTTLIDDFKKMKFPNLKSLGTTLSTTIVTAYSGLRTKILKMYGLGPDGKKIVVRGADGKFKKPLLRGMVESVQDMFKNMKTNLATYIDDALKGFRGRFTFLDPVTDAIKNMRTFFGNIRLPSLPEGGGLIGKFFGGVATFFKTAGGIFGDLLKPVLAVSSFIGGVVFDTIGGFFKSTGSVISGLFDFLGPVLKPIKSVLGIIGKFSIILTPFFALYDFIVGFWKGYTENDGSVLAGLEEGLLEVFRGFFTKPLDLLREYIVAPFVGLFSKDAEKAVKDFSVTELFNSAYNGIKTFVKELIGDPAGTIGNIVASLPNPIEIIGEKLFSIFVGVRDWIHNQSFLPDFLASPFEFLAESVGNLFNLDATGSTRKPDIEGAQKTGAGGMSAQQISQSTAAVKEAESSKPIVANMSSPVTNVQTTNNNSRSQHINMGAGAKNTDAPRTSVEDPMAGFS